MKAREEDRIKHQKEELVLKRRKDSFSETQEKEARLGEDISKTVVGGLGN